MALPAPDQHGDDATGPGGEGPGGAPPTTPRDVMDATLAASVPAAVLVDAQDAIRHLHGDIACFVGRPAGEPTDSLRACLRPELYASVDAALAGARETGACGVVHVAPDVRRVRVRALAAAEPEGWALVLFDKHDPPDIAAEAAASIAHLQHELARWRRSCDRCAAEHSAAHLALAAAHEDAVARTHELGATNASLEKLRREAQRRGEALAAAREELERRVDELRRRTDDLDNLLRSADVATLFLDAALEVRWFSPSLADIVPLTAADVGRPLADLAHRLVGTDLLVDAEHVLDAATPVRREVETRDGRWFVMHTRPYRTHEARIEGLVLTFADVTDLKRTELALDEQRELARHIVDTLREPLVVLDRELCVRGINAAFRRHFSRSDANTVGRGLFALEGGPWDEGPGDDGDPNSGDPDVAELRRRLQDVLPRARDFERFEIAHETPQLGRRTLRLAARRIERLDRILLTMEDVTEEKAEQARIERLALRDALTGLPNRILLEDRLRQAFAAASRNGTRAALVLLDLDGFKDVNDTLGHPAGDVVLREVSHRLGARIRAHDTLARLGGDEFAVVLVDLDNSAALDMLARRLMAAFAEPFAIDGHEARLLSVSSGIALFPNDGEDTTTLMRHADLALYRAKAMGR
ncbi:MAG: diguanylate cyclase domain-containing protein, partial [Pseudomonadota bacterium]